MEGSEVFKEAIKSHLDQLAASDPMFAPKYLNPKKKLDDCVTYIINWVKGTKKNAFTQDEIFGQAIHYYDEDNIKLGSPVNCLVVVAQASSDTLSKAAPADEKESKPTRRPQAKQTNKVMLPSLFD